MKNNNKLYTTIIGGKYKGKKLELPSLDVTRSSKARLKESFFNRLQFEIIDKVFIEAFSGSGSVGLEAVSRDAKIAHFIELDKNSYRVLEKNVKSIDKNKCRLYQGNTFDIFPNIIDNISSNEEIVIYIDPPFDFREGMEDIYENSFNLVKNIKDSKKVFIICFEHVSSLKMPETLGSFEIEKSKKFGKSTLTYYKVRDND